jgi:hypothetical protein
MSLLDRLRTTLGDSYDIARELGGCRTQLREEGRLAALAGDREGAIRAYRHYLALRSEPEPAVRDQVAAVRGELRRLERGTAGQ